MNMDLAIEELVLESRGPGGKVATRRILEEALALLSDKLVADFELWSGRGRELALEALELGELTADEIFSDHGAERLAEAMHGALLRRLT